MTFAAATENTGMLFWWLNVRLGRYSAFLRQVSCSPFTLNPPMNNLFPRTGRSSTISRRLGNSLRLGRLLVFAALSLNVTARSQSVVITPSSLAAPVITVPAAPLTTLVDAAFFYQIDASGSPSMFSATGLPTGLTVDSRSGLIHGTATDSGKFVVGIQAANASGTGTANLEIDVNALATVTVTAIANANASTGQRGAFVFSLGAASNVDLAVTYKVKGSAVPGVDYKALPGSVTIPAGATSARVKVKPRVDPDDGTKVIKLTMQAGAGYIVGTPNLVKVKIEP